MSKAESPKQKNMLVMNIILILLVIAIAAVPLFLIKNSEFGGSDGQAEEAIAELNKDYRPWFSPVWKPPGGETESLLFALQAALGAGFIGYFIGYARGKTARK